MIGQCCGSFAQLDDHRCVSTPVGDFLVETQIVDVYVLQVFYWDGFWHRPCRSRLPETTRGLRKARSRHERLVRLLDGAIVVPRFIEGTRRHRWLLKTSDFVVFSRSELPTSLAVMWKLRYG